MLAVLESDDLQLPAIEALITTDEEIGLLGAAALNGNELKGRTLLNMDSEEEGILTVSCAGGMTAMMDLPVRRSEVMGEQMEVTISGLAVAIPVRKSTKTVPTPTFWRAVSCTNWQERWIMP